MERMKKATRILNIVYLIFALVVFIFSVIGDFSNPVNNNAPLKYVFLFVGLSLCAYALILFIRKRDGVLEAGSLLLATVFTIAADTFLLMLQDHILLGVILFFVAQNLHYLRFLSSVSFEKRALFISLGYRVGLIVAGVIAALCLGYRDALSLWGIAYFGCLASNMIDAALAFTIVHRKYLLVLALGFLFFIGCDICVGLFNMLPASESSAFYPWIWLFYIPAQTAIISSGLLAYEE